MNKFANLSLLFYIGTWYLSHLSVLCSENNKNIAVFCALVRNVLLNHGKFYVFMFHKVLFILDIYAFFIKII